MKKLWYCDKKAYCANPTCMSCLDSTTDTQCSMTSDSNHWVKDFRQCLNLLYWDVPYLSNAKVNLQIYSRHRLPMDFRDNISMQDLMVQINRGLYSEFDVVFIKSTGQIINFDNPELSGNLTLTIVITEKEAD